MKLCKFHAFATAFLFASALLAVFFVTPAYAATYDIGGQGNGDHYFASLEELRQSGSVLTTGDVIILHADDASLTLPLIINQGAGAFSLTIQGNGHTVRPNAAYGTAQGGGFLCFNDTGAVTLAADRLTVDGFRVTGNDNTDNIGWGGAILSNGDLTFNDGIYTFNNN